MNEMLFKNQIDILKMLEKTVNVAISMRIRSKSSIHAEF